MILIDTEIVKKEDMEDKSAIKQSKRVGNIMTLFGVLEFFAGMFVYTGVYLQMGLNVQGVLIAMLYAICFNYIVFLFPFNYFLKRKELKLHKQLDDFPYYLDLIEESGDRKMYYIRTEKHERLIGREYNTKNHAFKWHAFLAILSVILGLLRVLQI
jgi:hypothetical protein